ncbi:MAG: EAL domain-containing protein [Pseudomonadales bacterium]
MTAQQPQHAPVRLLVAERSENAAHRYDSLLRDAGISTRLEIVDLPMALDRIHETDMMLCNSALPNLAALVQQLRAKAAHVPIILVSNEDAPLTAVEGLHIGAADVVEETAESHLVLVVQRELEHVCQQVRFRQMRRALEETEQRCALLLQSSRAAIAYVHEGMHIYANEGYLRLFGFKDADSLLGLPLIDLMSADSAKELKAKLKAFRQNEQEVDFDFCGASTTGETVSGNMTLAGADYEGEHCLQVTVRTGALMGEGTFEGAAFVERPLAEMPDETPARSVETPRLALVSTDKSDDDVPMLTNGIAGTPEYSNGASLEDAEPATKLDAHTEPASDPSADAPEETPTSTNATSELAAPAAINDETAEEEPAPAAQNDAPAVADNTPAAVNGANQLRGGLRNLSQFLDACEAHLAEHDDTFISVFVAQLDDYAQLQADYGLAGAEAACGQVEAGLARAITSPFMQLSPYQWAVLVAEPTRDAALEQVNAYRKVVEAMILEVREKTVRPTITLGGAILDEEGCDSLSTALEETLNGAFSSMQKASSSGDVNFVELPEFHNAEAAIDDEANRVLCLINEAIEQHKFMLLFQPIISLRGDSDEHYEVFLRMLDRSGEQMTPGEFLRTAIDNGVAGKIDRWVILQSIKMLSSHRAKGHNTRLTINVTSNSVADPEFIQWLGVAIKAARLPSDAVIFQITERDTATYVRQTREFVEGLKKLHCRASLSRFGVQAEPFELLKHIPVDFVKLDGTLIEDLNRNPDLKEGISRMIRDLQSAGKLTIVPMVESANVLSALWQAGANYIQGHYLQEPTTSMDYDFSSDD